MALNNNNFKGWLDQERRIINIQLLDDCRVLTENRLCSVYGLDQRPSVCLEAEADGCFCQLIPDTV